MKKYNVYILIVLIAIILVLNLNFDNFKGVAQESNQENAHNIAEQATEFNDEQDSTELNADQKTDIISVETNNNSIDVTTKNNELPKSKNEQVKLIKTMLPKISTIREEIKANPHSTPKSMIDFSKTVASLKKHSINSQENEDFLVNLLDSCSLDKNTSSAVNAFCAEELYLLSIDRQGAFAAAWKKTSKKIAPNVMKMVNIN